MSGFELRRQRATEPFGRRGRLAVHVPPGVPVVAEYYDRNELWPAESLARRRALLG